MNKKIIIPTILLIAVLIFSFFALSQEKDKNQISTNETTTEKNQSADKIILFYGDGCPHCAIVEEYINENKIFHNMLLTQNTFGISKYVFLSRVSQ